MENQRQISIYTTPTCVYCSKVKALFKKFNVSYQEYDVAADAGRRREMVEKSGQLGVPVVLIDDAVIIGFNESKLKELLNIPPL